MEGEARVPVAIDAPLDACVRATVVRRRRFCAPRARIIWWTDGAVTPKWRLHLPFIGRSAV